MMEYVRRENHSCERPKRGKQMGWPSRGFPCGTSIVGLHEDDYRRTACMSRSESTMEGLARQDISGMRRRVVVSPTNVTRPKSRSHAAPCGSFPARLLRGLRVMQAAGQLNISDGRVFRLAQAE